MRTEEGCFSCTFLMIVDIILQAIQSNSKSLKHKIHNGGYYVHAQTSNAYDFS